MLMSLDQIENDELEFKMEQKCFIFFFAVNFLFFHDIVYNG